MQSEIKSTPGITDLLEDYSDIIMLIENITMMNTTTMLSQLDHVDNMACSWLSVFDKIKLNDVYHGFESETDLVEYALHQAYKDKVMVMAGQ